MSLYDGLDIDNDESSGTKPAVAADWSSNYKLLQSQLQAKKASLVQAKRSKHGTTLAPVVDLKKNTDPSELHFNLQTGKMDVVDLFAPNDRIYHNMLCEIEKSKSKLERTSQFSSVGLGGSPFLPADPAPSLTGVTDEYDPLRPNDYEDFVKKRKEQRQKERDEDKRKDFEDDRRRRKDRDRDRDRERDRDRDRDRHRDRNRDRDSGNFGESEMERAMRRRREEEEEEFDPPRRATGSGAAIAPPTSLLEEDNSADVDGTPMMQERPKSPTIAHSMGLGGSIASKIMAKYGYKEGQGLGRQEQGMSTALYVEKTSKRGGKIIHEKDLPKEQPREAVPNTNLLRNPSKVILLLNMVGPGEVDEDLEPETAEECTKYGKVVKCLIFEIPGGQDEEAVRIFIEFEKMDSAIKAVIDLNGRYFGGRTVKASFYNLDKFRRLDLADDVE